MIYENCIHYKLTKYVPLIRNKYERLLFMYTQHLIN